MRLFLVAVFMAASTSYAQPNVRGTASTSTEIEEAIPNTFANRGYELSQSLLIEYRKISLGMPNDALNQMVIQQQLAEFMKAKFDAGEIGTYAVFSSVEANTPDMVTKNTIGATVNWTYNDNRNLLYHFYIDSDGTPRYGVAANVKQRSK